MPPPEEPTKPVMGRLVGDDGVAKEVVVEVGRRQVGRVELLGQQSRILEVPHQAMGEGVELGRGGRALLGAASEDQGGEQQTGHEASLSANAVRV